MVKRSSTVPLPSASRSFLLLPSIYTFTLFIPDVQAGKGSKKSRDASPATSPIHSPRKEEDNKEEKKEGEEKKDDRKKALKMVHSFSLLLVAVCLSIPPHHCLVRRRPRTSTDAYRTNATSPGRKPKRTMR